jgi:hypothetical protein
MRNMIINMSLMLVIGFGGVYLASPTSAIASCPDCRTCTGGCTGCFSESCDGSGSDCGKLEDSSGNTIDCGTEVSPF